MIHENQMKTLSFFKKYEYAPAWAMHALRSKGMTTSTRFPKFNEILSVYQTPTDRKSENQSVGLTVLDYMADPVMAKTIRRNLNISDSTGILSQDTKNDLKPILQTESSTDKPSETDRQPDPGPETIKKTGIGFSDETEPISIHEKVVWSVRKAAAKYNLPIGLINAVIKAESDFQVDAVSSSGALGLMQLMPETANELGVREPFDIDQNIDAGSRYLKLMLTLFDGDLKKALAAYNAGPGTVRKYKGMPPYSETIRYVHKVLKFLSITV